MCGRYVSTRSPQQIAEFFGAAVDVDPLTPSYNVAPTNDVYGVVADRELGLVVRSFHWGLVPVWANDTKIGSRMINARAETLAEKPSFKQLFRSRRIIVPMDGFYEWQQVPGSRVKQPLYAHRRDGELLAAAGLWSAWRDKAAGPDAPWLHSCTIVTTAANATMAPVHDRMPVFLAASTWAEWLDPDDNDLGSLASLLVPAPDDVLVLDRVSTAVNNVRNKGPELIVPVEPAE